jgi:hypothetical protein
MFHLLLHFLFNFSISYILGFTYLEGLTIAIVGLVVDFDHLIYYSIKYKNISIKKFLTWAYKEYRIHNPHFYIFHSVYTFMLIAYFSIYSGGMFKLVFFGVFLHLLVDVCTYILYYKSYKPWLRYLFY